MSLTGRGLCDSLSPRRVLAEEDGPAAAVLGAIATASLLRSDEKVKSGRDMLAVPVGCINSVARSNHGICSEIAFLHPTRSSRRGL
jgi:hypothetical protein